MIAYRILCVASLLCAACQMDPLRIPHAADGNSGSETSWRDAEVPPDHRLGDAQIEGPRVDMSFDACLGILEVCNGADDNCDGQIDEGLDKLNDPRYCEECKGCDWLIALSAFPGCVQGTCTITSCKAGTVNANNDITDGCELSCIPSGLEICDGKDNDCNGLIDDGVTLPQNICNSQGPCQGAVATCQGEDGWICDYDVSQGVELRPCTEDAECGEGNSCDLVQGVCPGIVILDESLCDGQDGDCDGVADDPWTHYTLPNPLGSECVLGQPCQNDGDCAPAQGSLCINELCTEKNGICGELRQWGCDPVTQRGVTCQLVTPGLSPLDEQCNGLDDDCDGLVDETADDAAGLGVKDALVHVNWGTHDFYIYTYEAARPDADMLSGGVLEGGRACSKPGVLPWAQVSFNEAQAACALAGMRLCSGDEWRAACQGANAPQQYPYGDQFQPQSCNGYEAGVGAALPAGQQSGCEGGSAGLFDMSGNLREWTSDLRGTTAQGSPIYVVHGGAYHTPAAGLSCTFDLSRAVAEVVLPAIGFRCCSSTNP